MANLSLSFDDGVATLLFDREGSSANLFDTATVSYTHLTLPTIA